MTTNGHTRIQLSHQEIETIRALVLERLTGKRTDELTDDTLAGLFVKIRRANKRVKVTH